MKYLYLLIIGSLLIMCKHDLVSTESNDDQDRKKYAPKEAVWQTGYYKYEIPPEGFTAVLAWAAMIDIDGDGLNCQVEIDYLAVHALVDQKDTILFIDEFDYMVNAMQAYSNYPRSPWFANSPTPLSFYIGNGRILILPFTSPDKVSHIWNTERAVVPFNASRVWVEAKVRIEQGAGVQIGIDYWKDRYANYAGYNINNTEAGVSDWYGDSTSEYQIITVGKPL